MTHSKNSYDGSLDTLQLLLFGLWRDIRSRFAHKELVRNHFGSLSHQSS